MAFFSGEGRTLAKPEKEQPNTLSAADSFQTLSYGTTAIPIVETIQLQSPGLPVTPAALRQNPLHLFLSGL